MASTGLPAPIAPFWSLQTLFPQRTFSFQRESLRRMPRLSGSWRDHSSAGTASPKHKFPLSFAPKQQRTLSVTLVRRECTSSRGQTELTASMPSSDSEATASDSSTCGPGTASLATTCHHTERADCADCAADIARNGEGIGNAERGSAEHGSSERRLIVAADRRRKAVLCSVIP